ncbi:MAG: class I SAM-dependent methyltransferase [Polyangiaceae bacterium]|nr:class I SAM-dependent methyltransferase [Polyangiaceae bacterium]
MAAARAIGSVVFQKPQILNDPYARHFLGSRYAALFALVDRLGSNPITRGFAALYDRWLPGALGWVLTRHRFFDDAINDAVARGAQQMVLVGAGYDSRAFRQAALANVRIFEVDHPDTQARKRRIVQQVVGPLPNNVLLIPLNATQGDLRKLPDYGFDLSKKAIFVIEGFLWYMPPETARSILLAIREMAAPGSQVIFDYILPSVVDGTCTLEGAKAHRAYCERRGEPILFGLNPNKVEAYLQGVGLTLVEDVDSTQLRDRYVRGEAPKIYPFLRIARCTVSGGD